jgi:hypothetical protein
VFHPQGLARVHRHFKHWSFGCHNQESRTRKTSDEKAVEPNPTILFARYSMRISGWKGITISVQIVAAS